MELVKTEVILIFDADYIPGAGLIKQLVAPFFDPEVGGVMGRVVPLNVGTNLLTRLWISNARADIRSTSKPV